MKTIYCFCDGISVFGSSQCWSAVALCEDGTVLAQHTCSSEYWCINDLGLISESKHENYDDHCGKGNWQLLWVNLIEMSGNVGFMKAIHAFKAKVTAETPVLNVVNKLTWYPHGKSSSAIDRFYMHMNEVAMLLRTNDLGAIQQGQRLMERYLSEYVVEPEFPLAERKF